MAGYVGRLEPGDTLDATPYFEGPWKSFERRTLEDEQSLQLEGVGAEYSVFVIGGGGDYRVGDVTAAATPGTAITVGYGASVTITAGEPGIDLFITTLNITAP